MVPQVVVQEAGVRQDQRMPGAEVAVGEAAVLVLLYEHGPMTVPQMGRAQALSRQFVQRMVNEAAVRGLVEISPNPAHKRSSLIRLTGEGAATTTALVAREREMLSQVDGELTDDDIAACLRVLTRMLEFLDDVDVDLDVAFRSEGERHPRGVRSVGECAGDAGRT
ncbi:hypothetical protein GCM10023195_62370 [Actinoallomurus liliacearum]|uniref:HTH marR-type domain-containing protein n=1 Tax=Actinoallomurus liliacearum TaxID=1080073 RepID=A0ABP8TTJ1_9ACTN